MTMTIDERLEALTQTVELIAHMQQANDKQIAELIAASNQDAENIRALARIAEIHEHRPTGLENSPNA
jgi:type IV secretory pathway ATPase VirB11/archaellum biosynthesis ATPase